MPNWKKIALSGSNPEFSSLNVDNAVTASAFTGSFTGDGSGLTNVSSTVTEQVTVTETFTSVTSSTVTHTFDTKNIIVQVYDDSDNLIIPQSITTTDTSTVDIVFDSVTSGRVIVAKGGHIVSGSITTTIVSSSTVSDTFTAQTSYTASHTFGTSDVFVQVYDNTDSLIIPQKIKILTTGSVGLDFDTATTGKVIIGKSGHIVSGSADYTVVGSDITDLGNLTVSGSILPHTTEVFDLGSSSKRWKDLYLSGSTIDLGGTKITRDATTGDIEFKDSEDNRKSIKVDELQIGTGALARKIKVSNGKVRFTDTSDTEDDTETAHVLPSSNNTYDLGSPTKQFRHLYLSSASLYVDGQKVLSSNADTLTFTTDTGQSIKLLETGADDIILQTDTGNIELKGTVEVLSGKKITDSAGTKVLFGDSLGITGSIDLTGTVDGIDLQAFSSSVATGLASSTADYTQLSNVPSGIVSSSAQVDYNSILNQPTIPTSNNELTNGAGYTTFTANQSLDTTSTVTFSTVTATSLTETSALRFKENIQEDLDTSIIDNLRPVSYDWKENGNKDYGFIAEEVNELDNILTTKDENDELLGIKYTKLIPFLVKKIQEQEERIKQLENGNS
jgi:hypothetical protein